MTWNLGIYSLLATYLGGEWAEEWQVGHSSTCEAESEDRHYISICTIIAVIGRSVTHCLSCIVETQEQELCAYQTTHASERHSPAYSVVHRCCDPA